jgi:formylglycine-generating enzyme required for sulfatase activity
MRRKLVDICAGRELEKPEQAAERLLADIREYAGLLLERGPGEYGFIHLTFQEYLAAAAIALAGQRQVEPISQTLNAHVDDDNWREVILLAVGYIGIIQQLDEVAGEVVRRLINAPGQPGQGVVLAGEAVLDAWPGGVDPQTRQRVIQVLVKTMAAERRVSVVLRAAAGNVLGRLGDPRPGVSLISPHLTTGEGPGVRAIPDIEFCHIPAGPFWLGSPDTAEKAYADEKPLHQVNLSYDYWISRYPITAAQFQAFSVSGGYQEARYWPEAEQHGEWRKGKIKHRFYTVEKNQLKIIGETEAEAPYDFGPPFNLSNHPIVGINWYEALAFCRWLEEQWREWANGRMANETVERERQQMWRGIAEGRLKVTLPSEAEWEKAVRGSEDWRRYPWGDEPDPNRANYDETGLKATNTVGCFPGGASPYGCEEMIGNVWEWTRTLWGSDSAKPEFGYLITRRMGGRI